jgi:phosphate transport system substrate-binding protein
VLVLATSCGGAALVTPAPETVSVAGSTSFAPALRELAAAYQTLHANALIDMRQSGTGAGVRAVSSGESDLTIVSWQPPNEPLPAGVRSSPVARDAVALIVHPTNSIRGLTLLQAKSIYQGEVQDWQALGGSAIEPIVVSREDGSGTRAAFEAMVMDNDRVTLNAVVMPSTQAVVEYVAAHPGAIGYVSAGDADKRVKVLSIEDVVPSATNVQNGSYRLARLIYVYRSSSASATARDFADFMLTPAGQAIIARHHIPLR